MRRRTGVESFGSDTMLGEDHFYPRHTGINLSQELLRISVLENWAICELPLEILRKPDSVSGDKVKKVQVEVSWLRGRPLCCSKESLSPVETGKTQETLQLGSWCEPFLHCFCYGGIQLELPHATP